MPNASQLRSQIWWNKWHRSGAVGTMESAVAAVHYAKNTIPTPEGYKCGNCGASGCKLWRMSHSSNPDLKCANCAATSQKKSIVDIDAKGRRATDGGRVDQIGWYVPAVPNVLGTDYYQYGAVPRFARNWWYRQPTLPQQSAA